MTTTALADAPLFHGLPAPVLKQLDAVARRVDLPPYEKLFLQGSTPGHLLVVVTGAVRSSVLDSDGNQFMLDVVGAPTVFGIADLLRDGPVTYTAETVGPAVGISIPRDVFLPLACSDPVLAHRLLTHVCTRVERMRAAAAVAALCSVESRLAYLLWRYAEVCGAAVSGGIGIMVDGLTQGELATSIGACLKSVGRAATSLRAEGIIEMRDSRWTVLDGPRLAQMASVGLAG